MSSPTHIRVDLVGDGSLLWVTTTLDGDRCGSVGTCQRHHWDSAACGRRAARLRAGVERANREGQVDRELLAEIERLGAVLFDDLFPPALKRRLRGLTEGYLTLGLTAELWDIPVELLHDGRDFVALRWAVGRQLLFEELGAPPRPRPRPTMSRILVLADPDGSLPECYNEGVIVRQLLGRAERADVAFHSTRVGRELVREELRDFDLVHVAGHLDEAGLRVVDGSFGAEDVLSLAGGLPMPRLVVLNGCASGDGSSLREGSLAGQLLGAGVEHLVGALYEVPDHLARDLAIAFWSELGRGVPIGEALRRARLALADSRGVPTAVWAAYALFGRPEVVYPLGIESSATFDTQVPVLMDRRPDAPEVAGLGATSAPLARLRAPGAAALAGTAFTHQRWLNQALLLVALGLLVALVTLAVPRLLSDAVPAEARGRVASEPAEVPSVVESPLSMVLLSEASAGPSAPLQLALGLEAPAFVELLRVAGGRVERLWPEPLDDGWLAGGRHLLPSAGAWVPTGAGGGETVLVVRRTSPDVDPEGLVVYLNALLGTLPQATEHDEMTAVVEAVLEREGGAVDRADLP